MSPHPAGAAAPSPAAPPASPGRYLLRVARAQTKRVVLGFVLLSVSGTAWILLPWVVSRIIDEVIAAGSVAPLAVWAAPLIVTALASSWVFAAGHRFLFMAESHSRVDTVRQISDHLNAAGTGARGKVSSGEMVNLSTEDAHKTGSFIFQLGFGWMGLVMLAVGTVVLWSVHPALGASAAGGSVLIGFIAGPALSRLQRRQIAYRARVAAVTEQASDVVGGLRVLRGIGGEDQFSDRYRRVSAELRESGYSVATSDSWIQALRTGLPLALIAAVTWIGARLALNGTITVGELSAAFGMTTLLAAHSGNLIALAQAFIVARVSARRLTSFFGIGSDIDLGGEATGAAGELHDPQSGLTIEPGKLTVIASAESRPAADALERLARYRDSPALWGRTRLAEIDLREVRERILLLREDHLFAQSLGETLRTDPDTAMRAIDTACAADVLSSLGGVLDAEVAGGGRNLSGGQRQRLRLARAIAVDPEHLLAVDPTSAVDAHTESLIAERVTVARRGRTTAIVTSSPLWLSRADRVAWLVDGKVRATGTPAELSRDGDFRGLTSRQESR